MPTDPKILAAVIAAISVVLSSGASALVALFLAGRNSKQEKEGKLIDYLNGKISKLENVKADIIEHKQSRQDGADLQTKIANSLQQSYDVGTKALSQIGHYLDDNATFALEEKRNEINKSMAEKRAVAGNLLQQEQLDNDAMEIPETMIKMSQFLTDVEKQIEEELRDAIFSIEKLGGG